MKLIFIFYKKKKIQLTLGQNELQPVDGIGTAEGNGLLEQLHHPFGCVCKKITNLLEHPGREAVISNQEVTSIHTYIWIYISAKWMFNNILFKIFLCISMNLPEHL